MHSTHVVEADQLRALSWVIKEPVVLVGEGLADLLVVGVQSHGCLPDSKLLLSSSRVTRRLLANARKGD